MKRALRLGPSNADISPAPDELQRGRQCCARRAWESGYQALSRSARARPLGAEDLELLALAAYMTGRDAEYLETLARAHRAHLEAGAPTRAARSAFWLGLRLLFRGEIGQANGWLGHARRLLRRESQTCVEEGYLLLASAQLQICEGELDAADASAALAVRIGEQFTEPDVIAVALHLRGRIRLQQCKITAGLALLDEAMLAVTAGAVSPLVTGLIYCGMIETCQEVYELARASEWTAALTHWCEAQPEMVAFSGLCLVHRAEILQLRGAWCQALAEAERAFVRCSGVNRVAAAEALYQQGEVHRLRGDFTRAEEAFREASRWGREPLPGLALLRLAQGRTPAASAAIRRALDAAHTVLQRAKLLPAYVEIVLASGEAAEALRASCELEALADRFDARALRAIAAQAKGAVELGCGRACAALVPLRHAERVWQELDAPYLAARVRIVVAQCCRALGDEDGVSLEVAAVRSIFERLGAAPDLTRLEALFAAPTAERRHPLTRRELEVLRWVAAGKTNKAIAATLCLSEKTVERHLSNIFTKLDVRSRAAATAYAFEHRLF